jgi:DNA sulfur modification protein DndD
MRIMRIRISNFRKLREFNITLDSANDSQLLLINANNGRGKTSLLKAFTWGLFNKAVSAEDFSKAQLKTLNEGEIDSFSVDFQIILNDQGDVANVRRAQEVQRVQGGAGVQFHGNEILTVSVASGDNRESVNVVPNPGQWLEKNLPLRFLDFIMFDGEKMSKFFDASVKKAIENAIKEIAKIDLFQKTLESLREINVRNSQKLAKLSGANAIKIQEELESKQRQAIALHNDIKIRKERSSEIKSEIRTHELNLKGNENAEKFLLENIRLRESITGLNIQRKSADLKISKIVFSAGIANLFVTRCKYALTKQVQTAQDAGKYPADFAPMALQGLLDSGKCICGCRLDENSDGITSIRKVITTSELAGDVGNSLKALEESLGKNEVRIQEKKIQLKEIVRELGRIKDETEVFQVALDELEPKLEGIKGNEDKIQLAKSKIMSLHDERESNLRSEAGLTVQLDEYTIAIQSLKKKLEKATASSDEANLLRAKGDMLERSIEQAANFMEEVIEAVRLRLQKSLSVSFKLVDGASNFETIVTKEFEVRTVDSLDREVDLSEGQKMIKAYMFSVALRDVVGLNYPLIVDTPIGRMDTGNVDLLSREIKKLFDGPRKAQVVMMMHDNEYTPYTKKKLEPLGPIEMYLEQNEDEDESTLKRGINPDWFNEGAWKDWNEGKIR